MTTPTSRFKAAIYEQISRIGHATASPGRLELLDLLSQGPRTVEALAAELGHSVANTSHHLQVLRRARLVEAEKTGLYVTYRLADTAVSTFFLVLRRLQARRSAAPAGWLFGVYLLGYAVIRFFIEFLRGDQTVLWAGLTLQQLLSIGALLAGGLLIAARPRCHGP